MRLQEPVNNYTEWYPEETEWSVASIVIVVFVSLFCCCICVISIRKIRDDNERRAQSNALKERNKKPEPKKHSQLEPNAFLNRMTHNNVQSNDNDAYVQANGNGLNDQVPYPLYPPLPQPNVPSAPPESPNSDVPAMAPPPYPCSSNPNDLPYPISGTSYQIPSASPPYPPRPSLYSP